MGWQLPSLAALRTFEAAARHLSFTKAASELNLTQSAVSRQIRVMEDYLGVLLFERVKQRLELTEAGRSYVGEISVALEKMQAATVNLMANKGRGGILGLGTPPAFSVKWLIPRLEAFSNAHPQILINLATHNKPFDFEAEGLDAAVYFGNNDWPGVLSDPLIGEEVVLACSPAYLRAQPPLARPADLARHVLLQQTRRPKWWKDWLDAKGVDINAWVGPRFDHFYMIMQAAVAGLGVALLPRLLISEDIAAGRLVIPFESPYRSADSYCLVYPAARRTDPKFEVFRAWLLAQAAAARGELR
ncbi:transcriptional regulator GcvA [Cupriavidus sp. 30B13]|uniref:transcriptional regulator GcvA n=1 Tax=Cupriavidus sp. 30B13 TaxID=3384241 RepID=UPI003B9142A5